MVEGCPLFKRCVEVFSSIGIPGTYINAPYHHCSCKNCKTDFNAEDPDGCCYFALQVDPRRNVQEIFAAWQRAYHGTHREYVHSIAVNGLLIPGDTLSTSDRIKEKPYHVPNQKYIFASPDVRYCLNDTYARATNIKGHTYQFVFELFFKPGSYEVSGTEWKTNYRDAYTHVALLIFEDYGSSGLSVGGFLGSIASVPPAPLLFPPVVKAIKKIKRRGRKMDTSDALDDIGKIVSDLCEICAKTIDKDSTFLDCGHVYHTGCIREFVNAATDGRILLTAEEKKDGNVSCLSCQKGIEETTIKGIFSDNILFYVNERTKREKEAKGVPMEEEKKVQDKKEEKKIAVEEAKGEKYWLSCCKTERDVADLKKKLSENSGSFFIYSEAKSKDLTLNVIEGLVPKPCPYCKIRMDIKDLKNLTIPDIKEGLGNNCANCNAQLRIFDTIMPCLHYLCPKCSKSPKVACIICDLLAEIAA